MAITGRPPSRSALRAGRRRAWAAVRLDARWPTKVRGQRRGEILGTTNSCGRRARSATSTPPTPRSPRARRSGCDPRRGRVRGPGVRRGRSNTGVGVTSGHHPSPSTPTSRAAWRALGVRARTNGIAVSPPRPAATPSRSRAARCFRAAAGSGSAKGTGARTVAGFPLSASSVASPRSRATRRHLGPRRIDRRGRREFTIRLNRVAPARSTVGWFIVH